MKERLTMGYKKILMYGLLLLGILIISIALTSCQDNEDSKVRQDKEVEPEITDIPAIDFKEPLDQAKADIEDAKDALRQDPEQGLEQDKQEAKLEDENSLPAFNSKEIITMYVIGDGVRMRGEPSTEAVILDSLSYGTEVQRLYKDGEWTKVQFQDSLGYIRNDLLSEERPMTRTQQSLTALSEEKLENPRIVVKKGERILELWDGDSLYGSYPIGLGWEPVGHKQREGDGRTPEGSYYVCVRNSNSRFYLSLGVSYPNKEDAKKALEEERIDQSTYDQIATAIDNGTQPPWYTPLGGEIMIHGMGSASDWTAGCIAVDNEVMDILWKYCPMNTPILIKP